MDFKQFGIPSKYTINDGISIDVPFEGTLRPFQKKIVSTYITKTKDTGCGLLEVPCGRGKCLGYNTPVLMFDNSIKMVQDIENGDLVMGDDYTSRNVSGTTRGISQMYKIIQSNGMDYEVE